MADGSYPEFNSVKFLLSCARRAADDYSMIADGDLICVGLSGGKDSIALLCTLLALRRFYPAKFNVCALTVDMGLGMDFSPDAAFCEKYGVPYKLVRTQIADVIFNIRKESNPCSLCARMRRGVMHDGAKEMGANKLALGHHFDDVVDTFMLNLLHEGRVGSFSPLTYLSRKDLTMIRPLIYAKEKDLRYFVNRNPDVPVIASLCPEDKHTERENVKGLLDGLERSDRGVKHRIFTALQKSGADGWHESRSDEPDGGSEE